MPRILHTLFSVVTQTPSFSAALEIGRWKNCVMVCWSNVAAFVLSLGTEEHKLCFARGQRETFRVEGLSKAGMGDGVVLGWSCDKGRV
jgi:hypothetical protein